MDDRQRNPAAVTGEGGASPESRLLQAELQWRALFDFVDDSFCVLEKVDTASGAPLEFRYLEANRAFSRETGVADVVGKTTREAFPERSDEQLRIYDEILATREPRHFLRELPAEGRVLDVYAFPLGDAANRRLGVRFKDYTAQIRAQEIAQRLNLALAAAGLGDWSWEASSDVVKMSARAAEIFGIPPGPHMTWAALRELLHPDDRDRARRAVEAAISSRSDYAIDYRIANGGNERWVSASGRPRYDARGGVLGMFGVLQDTTAEHRLLDEARSASRAKDEFLAILGHELRNPLSPILTALRVMDLRGEKESANERKIIERQVRHLTRLVDDLLDVSRIAQGKVKLNLEILDLAEVVARAVEMANPLFEQRQQKIFVDVPSGRLFVEGDAARLEQILSNLLTNASKYTPLHGTVVVSAHLAGFDGEATLVGDRDEIVLEVRDSGIGIPPDVLPHVFEIFVQDRQALDRSNGGLGLGLTIVRSLVERHGGRVSATSAGTGKGSAFVVHLPSARPFRPDVPAIAEEAAAPPLRRSKILVVDDNQDAAELLAQGLKLIGHEACVAHDGIAALALATEHRFEAAFLDIGLPAMDGYELAQRLRKLPTFANARLVAITGYGQPSDMERSRAAGFDEHLVKPVDLDAIERLIASWTGAPVQD
ncbi:MAG: ATP-binding protein [Thermoanaerobaculia bacterium]